MSPIMRRILDIAIVVALTCAVVFVVVLVNSFLVAGRGSYSGFNVWYAFIRRSDILGTMLLTAAVAFAYSFWQTGGRPRM
jgi:hypothetical protein